MATFISLLNFTDQGIRNVKQSPDRAKKFKEMAQKAGVMLKNIYWTVGSYDLVAIVEGPDDETTSSLLLSLGALGNVRTQTLRAFSAEEMSRIIAKMP
ncbi:MAG: GYD domain-containing protein [Gammaproteobacteria bacterium]|nr:GYD domain-containing protein [Gammaproteobacteria bacterium]